MRRLIIVTAVTPGLFTDETVYLDCWILEANSVEQVSDLSELTWAPQNMPRTLLLSMLRPWKRVVISVMILPTFPEVHVEQKNGHCAKASSQSAKQSNFHDICAVLLPDGIRACRLRTSVR